MVNAQQLKVSDNTASIAEIKSSLGLTKSCVNGTGNACGTELDDTEDDPTKPDATGAFCQAWGSILRAYDADSAKGAVLLRPITCARRGAVRCRMRMGVGVVAC